MRIFGIPVFPDQASTFAKDVDALYYFIVAVCAFFALAVAVSVLYFGLRYRKSHPAEIGANIEGSLPLELMWSVIPTIIAMVMFGWGASVFYHLRRPPADALQIYAVGKQWMWKFQHMEGQREINELHVPTGRPIKITISSEDVLHSLYFPSFRQKMDVIPGRYTTLWFEATKTGKYHLFCAEYCGMNHSGMTGSVIVMEQREFDDWLSGNIGSTTPATAGQQLYQTLGCASCHGANGEGGRGPTLAGIFGKQQQLQSGQTVTVDEAYIRESVTNPQAKLVMGFGPIMPTFQGQVSEDQLLQLIAFIKSLHAGGETTPTQAASPPTTTARPGASPTRNIK